MLRKLRQRKQAPILKRHIATMQNCGMSGSAPSSSPGNSSTANQLSPGAQSRTSPHPPQPGVGMKQSMGLPVGVPQAVQQAQAAAARQTEPHIVITAVKKIQEKAHTDPDLCVNSFDKDGHNHKMEKLGFGLDGDSSTSDQKQTNPQESKELTIQRYVQSFVHASQCGDANCRLPNCKEMKRMVRRAQSCDRKIQRAQSCDRKKGCLICESVIGLCNRHAEHCRDAKCPVPYCMNIRYLIKRDRIERRIRTKQNRGMSDSVPSSSPGNSSTTNQLSPGAQSHTSPHPPQPGVGMKQSAGPPVSVSQAVQQVQATTTRKTEPHMVTTAVNYGKGNPVISKLHCEESL